MQIPKMQNPALAGTAETDNMDKAAANDRAIRPFDMGVVAPSVRCPTLMKDKGMSSNQSVC